MWSWCQLHLKEDFAGDQVQVSSFCGGRKSCQGLPWVVSVATVMVASSLPWTLCSLAASGCHQHHRFTSLHQPLFASAVSCACKQGCACATEQARDATQSEALTRQAGALTAHIPQAPVTYLLLLSCALLSTCSLKKVSPNETAQNCKCSNIPGEQFIAVLAEFCQELARLDCS